MFNKNGTGPILEQNPEGYHILFQQAQSQNHL